MNQSRIIEQVICEMGMVVLARKKPMDYVLLGKVPDFYKNLFSHDGTDPSPRPWETSRALAYFMEDVEDFFDSMPLSPVAENESHSDNDQDEHSPEINSGVWFEKGDDGSEYALFVVGAIQNGAQVLIIRHLDDNFLERMDTLQKVRAVLSDNRTQQLDLEAIPGNAKKDAFKEVYTRTKLYELIHKIMGASQSNRSRLSLLFVQLVNLQEINQSVGHYAGDVVLLRLGTALHNQLRESDILVRYGTAGFAIIASNISKPNAQSLADKLLRVVQAHYFADVGDVRVAIGISNYEKNDTTQNFICRAEESLLQATKEENEVFVSIANNKAFSQTPE